MGNMNLPWYTFLLITQQNMKNPHNDDIILPNMNCIEDLRELILPIDPTFALVNWSVPCLRILSISSRLRTEYWARYYLWIMQLCGILRRNEILLRPRSTANSSCERISQARYSQCAVLKILVAELKEPRELRNSWTQNCRWRRFGPRTDYLKRFEEKSYHRDARTRATTW